MTTIYSFGYKMNGADQFATTGPMAPRIFDCRLLNNPHNDPELRRMTGRDKAVQRMVLKSTKATAMLEQAYQWAQDHPDQPIAFGCAYGKHRSVALAELLAKLLPDAKVIHTGAAK